MSYAIKDPAAVEPYKQLDAGSEKKIAGLTAELKPLPANDAEKAAAADIQCNLALLCAIVSVTMITNTRRLLAKLGTVMEDLHHGANSLAVASRPIDASSHAVADGEPAGGVC